MIFWHASVENKPIRRYAFYVYSVVSENRPNQIQFRCFYLVIIHHWLIRMQAALTACRHQKSTFFSIKNLPCHARCLIVSSEYQLLLASKQHQSFPGAPGNLITSTCGIPAGRLYSRPVSLFTSGQADRPTPNWYRQIHFG